MVCFSTLQLTEVAWGQYNVPVISKVLSPLEVKLNFNVGIHLSCLVSGSLTMLSQL